MKSSYSMGTPALLPFVELTHWCNLAVVFNTSVPF